MRLFGYYAWHSFVGQIKKIFRTWVIIFMLVCVAGGVGTGLLAGMTAGKVEDTQIAREKENPKEADKENPAGCHLFQGRLCQRARGLRRGAVPRARRHARERHHARSGQQAVYPLCGESLL